MENWTWIRHLGCLLVEQGDFHSLLLLWLVLLSRLASKALPCQALGDKEKKARIGSRRADRWGVGGINKCITAAPSDGIDGQEESLECFHLIG